jgi:hypothetical protein
MQLLELVNETLQPFAAPGEMVTTWNEESTCLNSEDINYQIQ